MPACGMAPFPRQGEISVKGGVGRHGKCGMAEGTESAEACREKHKRRRRLRRPASSLPWNMRPFRIMVSRRKALKKYTFWNVTAEKERAFSEAVPCRNTRAPPENGPQKRSPTPLPPQERLSRRPRLSPAPCLSFLTFRRAVPLFPCGASPCPCSSLRASVFWGRPSPSSKGRRA